MQSYYLVIFLLSAVSLVQIIDQIVGFLLGDDGNKFIIWNKVFYFCMTNMLIFSLITGNLYYENK